MRRNKTLTRLAILRRAMGGRKFSQRMLAEKCGLSEIYVRILESGARNMSSDAALLVSFATGASYSWLRGSGRLYPIVTSSGAKWTPDCNEVREIITTPDGKLTLGSKHRPRHLDRDYNASEATWLMEMLPELTDALARIIFSAYKAKLTPVVIEWLRESLSEISKSKRLKTLAKRFKVVESWPNLIDGVEIYNKDGKLAGRMRNINQMMALEMSSKRNLQNDNNKNTNQKPVLDLLERRMVMIANMFAQNLDAEFNKRVNL